MKKILPAFLLILCLICGIAAAETATEVPELKWADVEETFAKNLPGKIVEMDNYTFKYYLPDALAKEDREGYEFYYKSSDGYAFAAKAAEFAEDALDDYAKSLSTDSDFEGVTKVVLNGLDAVIYKTTGENQVACCSIEVEGGQLMTFYYGPTATADDYTFAVALFSGIQL